MLDNSPLDLMASILMP